MTEQVFVRLCLLEISSNLTRAERVGNWPRPRWAEHHWGAFCFPSPSCHRRHVCHSFTDTAGIISKRTTQKNSTRESKRGTRHSNQLFPETAAGYFSKLLACFGALLCSFCFWAGFECRYQGGVGGNHGISGSRRYWKSQVWGCS